MMRRTRTKPWWVVSLATALAGAACHSLSGGAGSGGAGSEGAGSGSTGNSSTTGDYGYTTVTSPPPGFTLAIGEASVAVPVGATNLVHLTIARIGGFTGAVDVTLPGAPSGLVAAPFTIPSGSTTATLAVSAGTLSLGTKFSLTLTATSEGDVETASVPAVVTGKAGILDLGFGSGGIAGATSASKILVRDVLEVDQGRILVAGDVEESSGSAVFGLRYLADGTLDTSFNGTGAVAAVKFCPSSPASFSIGIPRRIAREADGTVVFVGQSICSAAGGDIDVRRYRDDGTPDVVGGDSGVETIDLAGDDVVTAAELIPSTTQAIVIGTTNQTPWVARIADRGAVHPDPTFAAPKGWRALPSGFYPGAVALDAANRIVIAGQRDATSAGGGTGGSTGGTTTTSDDHAFDVGLIRLTPDGAYDTSFGSGGIASTPRLGSQDAWSVLVQPDGKIVVAGSTDEGGSVQLLVQRFLATGALDDTFGTGGGVLAPLGKVGVGIQVARLPDGRLIVGADADTGVRSPLFVRLLSDGSLDPTFGVEGVASVYVGDGGAFTRMSLSSDGSVIFAGVFDPVASLPFVARLFN